MEKLENGAWLHPGRLPLGCGWSGQCTAPQHEGEMPSAEELQRFCNLGYANGCRRLPAERSWDAVRFAARAANQSGKSAGGRIQVRYVCERGHLPVEHGLLEYDPVEKRWERGHPDRRVQSMAECFLAAQAEKVSWTKVGAASEVGN